MRDYGEDTATIWGGDERCEHDFSPSQTEHDNLRYRGATSVVGNEKNEEIHKGKENSSGVFCSKCGCWRGQLGLEPSPDLYIEHLRMVFAEVKRVLKKTGTCWVNIGDSYSNRGECDPSRWKGKEVAYRPACNLKSLPPKCMVMVPERFAFMMFDLGYTLRNKIIWKKDNPMPISVKDRFNTTWEYVYFFTKNNKPVYWYNDKTGLMVGKKPTSQIEGVDWDWKEVVDVNSHEESANTGFFNKEPYMENNPHRVRLEGEKNLKKVTHWHSVDYWFDLDAVREPHTESGIERAKYKLSDWKGASGNSSWCQTKDNPSRKYLELNPSGKNPGDVFVINTEAYPDAHFATFPMKLVKKPLLAGCPAEVCKHCGMARVRITKSNSNWDERVQKGAIGSTKELGHTTTHGKGVSHDLYYNGKTIGWTDCLCGKNPNSCFFCGYNEEHGNLKLKNGIYICDECLLQGKGLEDKWHPGIVLDPFAGSGTVGIVAEKFGRSSILIDIKKDYCKMTFKRLKPLVEQTKLSGERSTIKKEGF